MKLHKMLRDFLNILSEFYIGCVEKLRQILTLGSKSLTNRQYLAIDANLGIANHDLRAALLRICDLIARSVAALGFPAARNHGKD